MTNTCIIILFYVTWQGEVKGKDGIEAAYSGRETAGSVCSGTGALFDFFAGWNTIHLMG
jgi:hypothetical protein